MSDSEPVASTDGQKTVLVADDDAMIRRALTVTLQYGGYRVLNASDGEEALATARGERPDLLLLDVHMPKLHGYEVCRQLKADPATQHIVIFMLTARVQDEDRTQGMEAGADDYLTKPFSPRDLLDRLRTRLSP